MHDPRQVGPWTIHSRLGAGGMGVVFYASSPGYEGAALKVIRPGLLDAPATRDRFRREVAILRSVRDAHISEFLSADLESEPAWLAIEYVGGPTLRDEIAENGPLSEDEWW
jgi:serine/threonine protein kinase